MPNAGRILVVADDLSGAAEVAGLAFQAGLTAEVQRVPGLDADADVVALDTDTRLLSADAAAGRVHTAMQQAAAGRFELLFKKTDSLVRGNVRAELEAALQATGLVRAMLVPANPSRGRTMVAGRYLVDGQPLAETALAADPHHPRGSSDVRALLGAGRLDVHLLKAGERLPDTGIIVPDVATSADLNRLAELTDGSLLAAGAADYFQALLEQRRGAKVAAAEHPVELKPTAVLICGSRVTWPQRQNACQAVPMPVVLADGSGSGPLTFGAFLLGIGEEDAADPASALQQLAGIASAMIPGLDVQTVLIEGGATSAAVAQKLGWHRLAVVAAAPAGVGVLRPVPIQPAKTPPHAPLVLIKPGSYAWPQEIWSAFCALARS